jgi:nitrogen fixation protein NifU and related proteins
MYNKKIMEYFLHPRNMGEIKNPDGVGQVGNPVCGDVMKIFIKVKNNKISDIKFQTLGCAAAIATCSMITDLAKGKTLEQAKKLTKDDVAQKLKGLPPIKMHCSNLASDALRAAIKDYKSETKLSGESVLSDILNDSKFLKVLEKYNLPCLHCPMAIFEMKTLKIKEICKNYGINMEKLLKELNKIKK